MKKFTFFAKAACVLLAISILPLTSFSQHFSPAVNNGTGNWHFYPVHATLLGADLVIGDEIAVFDGNVCVGSHILNDTLDGSYALAVGNNWLAYEKDGADPGYTGGNAYSWRCWDASAGIEYTGAMTYNTDYGPQNYVGGVFPASMEFVWSWIDLNFTTVAAASGDVSGTITNALTPFDSISGVTVTATGTVTYTTVTNSDGYYIFDGIDEDTYNLTTSHNLYVNGGPAAVTIVSATPKTQDFVLNFKSGWLEGYVKDQVATGIVGASVTIDGHVGTSGAGGHYVVVGIDSGYYDAVATVAAGGYAPQTVTNVLITPNDTTDQNFTLVASGTLEGIVSAGGADRDDVTVTVVETGDTFNSGDDGTTGDFTFQLPAGTYSLTFEHSIVGFHNGYSSGLVVTVPGTTNADKVLYADNWTFTDGDPFSAVWTVYLNTIKVGGSAGNAGDEISIWTADDAGSITSFAPLATGTGDINADINGALTVTETAPASGVALYTTGAAHTLTTGDFVEIWNGAPATTYDGNNQQVTVLTGTTFTIGAGAAYLADATADWFKEGTNVINVYDVAHGLVTGDIVTLNNFGSVPNFNGTTEYTVTRIDGDNFEVAEQFLVSGSDYTGDWNNVTGTVVTSAAHGLVDGQSVTITNSGNGYNGTHIISAATTNTFQITTNYAGTETADWAYTGVIVGKTNIEGLIENEGYDVVLKAFSVLDDGSPGYAAGQDFDFKLYYSGTELTTTSTLTWTATGSGLTDPGTTFPTGEVFSQVSLVDFALSPGDFSVDFQDEGTNDPDVDLELTLKQGATTIATYTWAAGPHVPYVFTGLDPGDYSLVVTGNRFVTTTYTGNTVPSGGTLTELFTINHFADETQTINLVSGYQLISRRVDGDSYDMSDYITTAGATTLAPTPADINKLVMTKDQTGTSDNYNGGALVADGNVQWNILQGYNFKMNATDVIAILGRPIAYNATLDIRAAAYSMISYLPDYTLDAEVAFADLMTNDLDFIRDGSGNSLTKVGGVWVDHIGNCTAGEGFLVKWAGAQTDFNYPAQTTKSANANDEDMELVHFPFYDGYGNPMSDVFTMYISGSDLEVGDEIGAFDGSTLVGATVITSDIPTDNNLNAFEELFDKGGFDNGNQIILKVWKANEDKEYFLNFENVSEGEFMYKGVTYPSGDGNKSTMDVTLSPAGIIDNLADYINVYPNPSMGFVTISSPEQIDRLMLVNLVGQTLIDLKPESGITELNLDGFNPGIYFVNIIIDGQRVTKKLTIQ